MQPCTCKATMLLKIQKNKTYNNCQNRGMPTNAQASGISFKTLGGVFDQPKMNHRRDFLRENKLSLRDLQKSTNQKLTQQKQELESRQYKYLPKFHKTQEQSMTRRSNAQCKNVEGNCLGHSRTTVPNGVVDESGGIGAATRDKRNYFASRRSYSQQRIKVNNLQPACTCCCDQAEPKARHIDTQYREHIPRSASSVSVLSKAESCDKEIQTEDIHDEDFLYEALKKCSSSDVHFLQKQKSADQLNTRDNYLQNSNSNYNLKQYEPESNLIHSRVRTPYICQTQYEDNKSQHDQISQYTPRSQNICMSNVNNHVQEDEVGNSSKQDLEEDFQNLKIATDMKRDAEAQSSARSRQTMCSTSTKRSVHKLGSREDVHLPLYLKKEKREKEEERIRELNKDINCPLDHYTLSEEERLNALNKAQQKMASLINELNHMPMTMETLRIRNRKAEIEKELTQIEFDIRLYSKPKVYLPKTTPQY